MCIIHGGSYLREFHAGSGGTMGAGRRAVMICDDDVGMRVWAEIKAGYYLEKI